MHGDNADLIRRLLPVLEGRADLFLAGHDHDMQHLEPEGGVHFFVAGTGGANVRKPTPVARSKFALDAFGFAVLEADAASLKVTFVGTELETIYRYALAKDPAAAP